LRVTVGTTRGRTEEETTWFVEGALEPHEAERISAILEQAPAAGALAEGVGKTNVLLQAAYKNAAGAPGPLTVAAALSTENEKAVPFRRRFPKRGTWISFAAAADSEIVVGFTAGTQRYTSAPSPRVKLDGAPRNSDLQIALETPPRGTG